MKRGGRTTRSMLPLALLALAGCTTYKLWTEYDATPEQGLIQLAYDYRKFESPRVDERGAIEMARERCRGWGFGDAHRKGEDRQCIAGVDSDCSRWRVVREYRCTKK